MKKTKTPLLTQEQVRAPFWLIILTGAFFTGFMWRVRGDTGFGSFEGMAAVATGLLLLIMTVFPYRKKMNALIFPVAVFLTAITNSGWGTLNSQVTGMLECGISGENAVEAIEISPLSGVIVMLLVGFGWAPFFAAFVGWYFSDKKWKLKDFLLLLVIYYGVVFASKASVAHLLVSLFSPEATSAYQNTLTSLGKDLTPFAAYMKHFDNIAWAKKQAFGRNYFQEIETVSQALGTIAVLFFVRCGIKDKIAARLSALSACSLAFAITLADVFLFVKGGGYRNSLTPPAFLSGWSNWEYFTGFFFGLFLFTGLCIFVKHRAGENAESIIPVNPWPDNKAVNVVICLIMMLFPVITGVAVPIGERLADEDDFFFGRLSLPGEWIMIVPVCLIFALIIIVFVIRKTQCTDARKMFDNAPKNLLIAFAVWTFAYFFIGNSYLLRLSVTDTTCMMYISVVAVLPVLVIWAVKARKNTQR